MDIPIPPSEFVEAVGGGDFQEIGRAILALVQKRCGIEPTHRVLDIGSGCGRLAVPLTRHMNSKGAYDGFDVVKPMVDWCRDNISAAYPNFRFHHADLTNSFYSASGQDPKDYTFPFADAAFHRVVATSVFTHLLPDSAARYAAEIGRVLDRGGRAFLSFFLMTGDYKTERAEIKLTHHYPGYSVTHTDNPEAVIALDEQFVLSILRSSGLAIDDISYGSWSGRHGGGFQDVIVATKT